MAGISFEDYFLNEISYKKNQKFSEAEGLINANLALNVGININKKEEKAVVNMIITVGDLQDSNSGFETKIDIVGLFNFNQAESDGKEFEEFMSANAVSILYSYTRPYISDLIAKGNEFPRFLLPVLNINKFIEENNNSSIVIRSDENID